MPRGSEEFPCCLLSQRAEPSLQWTLSPAGEGTACEELPPESRKHRLWEAKGSNFLLGEGGALG